MLQKFISFFLYNSKAKRENLKMEKTSAMPICLLNLKKLKQGLQKEICF